MVAGQTGKRGHDAVQHATLDKELVSGHATILPLAMVERIALGRRYRAHLVKFSFALVKSPEMKIRKHDKSWDFEILTQ